MRSERIILARVARQQRQVLRRLGVDKHGILGRGWSGREGEYLFIGLRRLVVRDLHDGEGPCLEGLDRGAKKSIADVLGEVYD